MFLDFNILTRTRLHQISKEPVEKSGEATRESDDNGGLQLHGVVEQGQRHYPGGGKDFIPKDVRPLQYDLRAI